MIFQDPLTSLNPLYRIGEQLIETIQTHLSMDNKQARIRAIELLDEVGIPAPKLGLMPIRINFLVVCVKEWLLLWRLLESLI